MKKVGRGRRRRPRDAEGLDRSDPFQILEAEHERLRAHVRRTTQAAGDAKSRERAAIASLLTLARRHMDREAWALYPLCAQLFGEAGAVSVLQMDHVAIREALAALNERTGDMKRRLDELSGLLEGHLAREERVLFPMMAALLSGMELHRLARQLRSGILPGRSRS